MKLGPLELDVARAAEVFEGENRLARHLSGSRSSSTRASVDPDMDETIKLMISVHASNIWCSNEQSAKCDQHNKGRRETPTHDTQPRPKADELMTLFLALTSPSLSPYDIINFMLNHVSNEAIGHNVMIVVSVDPINSRCGIICG